MGSVWKARDERLDRIVAIKLLTGDLALSPQARRRFLREARAASRLNHPGIAAVHDAGEVEGQLYLVATFVDGITLRERLRGGPLPMAEAVDIARQVAEALQHAHEHGVIHRDVSSSNVMVDKSGHPTLIDLGLARLRKEASTRLTPTGGGWGTFPYIAPEVIRDHDAGPRSDIYSLGVVLYELLTGGSPFEAPALEAVVNMILNQKPDPPSRRRPEIPIALDRIVLKAMAKDPTDRHASAAALVRSLVTLGRDGTTARRRPTREVSKRPSASRVSVSIVPPEKFLVVMPFKDTSLTSRRPARAQQFARGLAETLSARLSRVPGVHVIPPSALPAPSTSTTDLMVLEREVGANLVLFGSVQHAGRRVRIGFSLVGPDRVQLAGDTLDGSMQEILDLEDQLVRRIARSLELEVATLAPEEGRPDPAAHERYLQALGYLQRYENEASIDGAIGLLEKLARSNPADARVLATLGRAYLAKYILTFEPEWESRAESACQRALRLDPELPEVLVTLGNVHRESGRCREAVEAYRHALRLRPDDPEALCNLAVAYQREGDLEKAEKALRQAIVVRPNSWSIHNTLGVLYFNQARYEEAAHAWERVLQLTPDNARGHYNLAAAKYHLGRYTEAVEGYERSLQIRPDATAYTSLGTVFFYLGDRERAIAVFEKGKELRPSDPGVWGNLADAYRWTPGYEDRAGPAFDRAIALKRNQLKLNRMQGKGWTQLASWLAKRGRLKESLRALRRGLELSPRDVNCMTHAIRVYHLNGDRDAAMHWLRKAVQQGCDVAELQGDPELAELRETRQFSRIVQGGRRRPPGKTHGN